MYQIDPAACVLAVIALIFAWRVERRNTTVILSIRECEGHSSITDENNGQLFHTFRVLIKNLGISLHNPTVAIRFRDCDGHKLFTLERVTTLPSDAGEFSKGMLAEFALKSYNLSPDGIQALLLLQDPKAQDAFLEVRSQDFVAGELKLAGRYDRLCQAWNRWVAPINERFWRDVVTPTGNRYLDPTNKIPTMKVLEPALLAFVNGVRRMQARPAPFEIPSKTS